jgi:hypothetical protein
MTETLPQLETGRIGEAKQARSMAQAGAVTFADLAWSHFWWELARHEGRGMDPEIQKAYLTKLGEFEKQEGKIAHAYWSTRAASAVAMTEKVCPEATGLLAWVAKRLKLHQREHNITLHRVTDWLMSESDLADLLQQCDLMAARVGELLRGGNQRIAMRWLYGVMEHILGFIERTEGSPTGEQRKALVKSQRGELKKIEGFYLRAGGQAGRIVYVSGMLIGTGIVALIAVAAALVLWAFGLFDGDAENELGLLFLCYGAGTVGALVSVMSRLRPGGKFDLDFEVGRPLVRRLGLFRPAVGAIFGMLLYALLQSGILILDPTDQDGFAGDPVFYFAVAAFIAGFSERWVHVVIGGAKRTIAPDSGDEN